MCSDLVCVVYIVCLSVVSVILVARAVVYKVIIVFYWFSLHVSAFTLRYRESVEFA